MASPSPPPPPTTLRSLNRDVLLEVCARLDPASAVALAGASHDLRSLIRGGEDYHRDVARRAWGVLEGGGPVDPRGRSVPSWRESVAAHEALLGALGPHGRQAAAAWHKILAALALAGRHDVRATLAAPHPPDALARLRRCGWHPALVAHCSIVDGQPTIGATLDVVRRRDAPLGLLGALGLGLGLGAAAPPGATLHLLPLVTAKTRSTLRPPGGQSARPAWIPLAAVPASGERAVVAAAAGAAPALLARRLEVNVATGAVRLAGRASAVRADGGRGLLAWLDAVAARMLAAAAAPSPPPLQLLDVATPFVDDAPAGPLLRVTAWALASPAAARRVDFSCVARVANVSSVPVFVHSVCVRRAGEGEGGARWRAAVDAAVAAGDAAAGFWVAAADQATEVELEVDVDVGGVRRLVPVDGGGVVTCWGGVVCV